MLDMLAGQGNEAWAWARTCRSCSGSLCRKSPKKRKLPVKEARKVLTQEEANKLIDMDDVIAESVAGRSKSGIIFIDEIDKIASPSRGSGPDVSREGVQRDILPIVEGSTVMTKYGPVKTDYCFLSRQARFIWPSRLI